MMCPLCGDYFDGCNRKYKIVRYRGEKRLHVCSACKKLSQDEINEKPIRTLEKQGGIWHDSARNRGI